MDRSGIVGRLVTAVGCLLLAGPCLAAEDPRKAEAMSGDERGAALFPSDLPERQWQTFHADGFSEPVVGVIYRNGGGLPYTGVTDPETTPIQREHWPLILEAGVPLGGIGTGYATLRLDGRIGSMALYNNLINPFTGATRLWWHESVPQPRNIDLPCVGLSVGRETRVLSLGGLEGVDGVRQIHYWGHYPVADLEYELDLPVSVALRAWSPFIPGDAVDSNIPGAIFELRVRNVSDTIQHGTIAFSIPGPDEGETQGEVRFERELVRGAFTGVAARTVVKGWMALGYALGVVGERDVRVGGELGSDGAAWTSIGDALPEARPSERGSSVAVDFALDPGETEVVRFVLAWFAPIWPSPPARYMNMYYQRFKDALDVADLLATEHASLLARTLGWQQVVYAEEQLPECLRDYLVNSLHLIAKGAAYAWLPGARPGDGLLVFAEGARSMPAREPLIHSYWGLHAITYFFPDLRRNTLWMAAAFQLGDGRVPITVGVNSFDDPHYGHYLVNGYLYTQMVDQLWQRTGDDDIVRAFYPSVKRAIEYLMGRSEETGLILYDPIDPPRGQPFDSWDWRGHAAFSAGQWLCGLRSAERMAELVGDGEFAEECQEWSDRATRAMEEILWNEEAQSYSMYMAPGTEYGSDTVHTYQLEGSLGCALVGLPEVFPADRLATTLGTIERLCVRPISVGAANAMRPDGTPDREGGVDSEGIFPSLNALLAALYAYQGNREVAEEIVEQMLRNLVLDHLLAWDFPQGFFEQDGVIPRGSDSYWGMSIWAVPPALYGQDIREFCGPGGFVDRILEAGRRPDLR